MSATGLAKRMCHSSLCASLIILLLLFVGQPARGDDLVVDDYHQLTDHEVRDNVMVNNGGTLDVMGFTLTISGNLIINSGGSVDVNGGSISVGGNITIRGLLDINAGSCTVEGNLTVDGSDSYLKMVNAADLVEVVGNVIFSGASTKQDTTDYLSAGTLRVAGDFAQEGTTNSYASNPRSENNRNAFTATGTHKVVLNGSGPQRVSFQSSSADFSHFQNLEINKPGGIAIPLSDDGEASPSASFPAPEAPWGISASPFEGNGCWSDSPEGSYASNSEVSLTSESLDLTSAQGTYLTFWHRYDVEINYDYCKVEVSVDDGSTWNEIKKFTGQQISWKAELIDLSSYDGEPAIRIRFLLDSDGQNNADGWYIDKIRVKSGSTVRFTGSAYVAGQWTLQSDATIMGSLTIIGGLADMNGHALSVDGDWTVNETAVNVNTGSLHVASLTIGSRASFDLNGGSLAVGNDMTVQGSFALDGTSLVIPGSLTINGVFDVNGGTCSVGGDLTVQGGNAYLKMVNPAEVVEVAGSVLFNGHNTYWVDGETTHAYLSAGTLKVGGILSSPMVGIMVMRRPASVPRAPTRLSSMERASRRYLSRILTFPISRTWRLRTPLRRG